MSRAAAEAANNPSYLTTMVKGLVLRAQLEGQPSRDYHEAIRLLGKAHQEVDRLYWPAKLAEAEFLFEKYIGHEAVRETLELHRCCGRSWYLMGRLGLNGFNFEQAEKASKELCDINTDHLLADLLDTQMYLHQRDVSAAQRTAREALTRYPLHRELLAMAAACRAMAFDERGLADALAAFGAVAPSSPMTHCTVGKYLSLTRQYDASKAHLHAAIERFSVRITGMP